MMSKRGHGVLPTGVNDSTRTPLKDGVKLVMLGMSPRAVPRHTVQRMSPRALPRRTVQQESLRHDHPDTRGGIHLGVSPRALPRRTVQRMSPRALPRRTVQQRSLRQDHPDTSGGIHQIGLNQGKILQATDAGTIDMLHWTIQGCQKRRGGMLQIGLDRRKIREETSSCIRETREVTVATR